ncbi:hypothetical protein PoB_000174800 [Plakobranchus ocellatus]|uniref:Uncharacterized protein n=1 Tax=Plakobranchus ocellatus TaxID=259542 RepID=A0AAV3XXZ9_9GAST|nr:hypothetical protein PoB_000174800 [Plakobranchus ocellatus]
MIADEAIWTGFPIIPNFTGSPALHIPESVGTPADFLSLLLDMDTLKHIKSESKTYAANELSKISPKPNSLFKNWKTIKLEEGEIPHKVFVKRLKSRTAQHNYQCCTEEPGGRNIAAAAPIRDDMRMYDRHFPDWLPGTPSKTRPAWNCKVCADINKKARSCGGVQEMKADYVLVQVVQNGTLFYAMLQRVSYPKELLLPSEGIQTVGYLFLMKLIIIFDSN